MGKKQETVRVNDTTAPLQLYQEHLSGIDYKYNETKWANQKMFGQNIPQHMDNKS